MTAQPEREPILHVEIMVAAGQAIGRAWTKWSGPVERLACGAACDGKPDNVQALRGVLTQLVDRAERTMEGGELFEPDPRWRVKHKKMFEDLKEHALYFEFMAECGHTQAEMHTGRNHLHHLWAMPHVDGVGRPRFATPLVSLGSMVKHQVLPWLDAGEAGEL
jgi:hypothetical protein